MGELDQSSPVSGGYSFDEFYLKDHLTGAWVPGATGSISFETQRVREVADSLLWRDLGVLEELLKQDPVPEEAITRGWELLISEIGMERFCAADLLVNSKNDLFGRFVEQMPSNPRAFLPLAYLAYRWKRGDEFLARLLPYLEEEPLSVDAELLQCIRYLDAASGVRVLDQVLKRGNPEIHPSAFLACAVSGVSHEQLEVIGARFGAEAVRYAQIGLEVDNSDLFDRTLLHYEMAFMGDATDYAPCSAPFEEQCTAIWKAARVHEVEETKKLLRRNPFHPAAQKLDLPYATSISRETFVEEIITPWNDIEEPLIRELFILRIAKARTCLSPEARWLALSEIAGAFELYTRGVSCDSVQKVLTGDRTPLIGLICDPERLEGRGNIPAMRTPGALGAMGLALAAGRTPELDLDECEMVAQTTGLPSIGIEIQAVRPKMEYVIGWKELLDRSGVGSPYRPDLQRMLEVATCPCWSAETIDDSVRSLAVLGFFDVTSEPVSLHVSIGADLGGAIGYLCTPLLALNTRWISLLRNADASLELSGIMSKGLVCRNTEVLLLPGQTKLPFRTEIRALSFSNYDDADCPHISELSNCVRSIQILAFAALRASEGDPLAEGVWSRYTEALSGIMNTTLPESPLLSLNWAQSTGDGASPELVDALPIVQELRRVAETLSVNAAQREKFIDSLLECWDKAVESAAALLM